MTEYNLFEDRSFLGRGWRYPVGIDEDGKIALSSGEQDIREAIWIILATAPGERVMRPDFGCGIHEMVFTDMTPANLAQMKMHVEDAMIRWEPRIEVDIVDVAADQNADNRLLISIDYRVRVNNARGNLVYPFYIEEGK